LFTIIPLTTTTLFSGTRLVSSRRRLIALLHDTTLHTASESSMNEFGNSAHFSSENSRRIQANLGFLSQHNRPIVGRRAVVLLERAAQAQRFYLVSFTQHYGI
jgi:hypothetical protein